MNDENQTEVSAEGSDPEEQNTTSTTNVSFHFRKDTVSGVKRESVSLPLTVPTLDDICNVINTGGKELELLLSCVSDVVIDQARSILGDQPAITGADDFPFDQCTWEFIANIPPTQRKARGIPKEVWEAFGKDWVEVMQLQGKSEVQAETSAKMLLNKLVQIKGNKPVLEKIVTQLGDYIGATEQADEFAKVVAFLTEKAEGLLGVDEAALLDAI